MLNFLVNVPILMWTFWAFVLGAAVGSLLNVCIWRLPLEKSVLWPSSRCGNCLQPIRWSDNIPLISYWRGWLYRLTLPTARTRIQILQTDGPQRSQVSSQLSLVWAG